MFGLFKRKAKEAEDPRTTKSSRRVYEFIEFLRRMPEEELKTFAAWAEGTIQAYGRAMEAYPGDLESESVLPASKQDIKLALKTLMAYRLGPQEKDTLEALKAAWLALARYQPGDAAQAGAQAAAETLTLKTELRSFFR